MMTAGPTQSSSSFLSTWRAHSAALSSRAHTLVKEHFAEDQASIVCVPTAKGGEGHRAIEAFLKEWNSGNGIIEQKLMSRVLGRNSVAEESILTVVHDVEIDWLLPGVKPTRRRIVIPLATFVNFDEQGKIISKRMYWDQGSVMKQIGLLPVTVFCKANNTETTLPVLGPKIIDRLEETWGEDERRKEAEEMETQQDDRNMRSNGREAAAGILPGSHAGHHREEDNRPHSASSRASVSSLMTDSSAPQYIRKSTRGHAQANGSVPLNLFGGNDDVVPLKTSVPIDPRRFESHFSINGEDEESALAALKRTSISVDPRKNASHFSFGDEGSVAPSAEHDDGVYTHSPVAAGISNRRDPNWQGSESDRPSSAMSGKRTYGGAHSESHFEFAGGSDTSSVQRSAYSEPHQGGRKHSVRAHENNDIFGPATVTPGMRPGSNGRRDPNARSVQEDDPYSRPSSRVTRPPGGASTFSIS
ncbi:hypothetical protein DFS34DRAFT_603901 [Phlyctochytrium arcticum]|nr:hypothetical protein DFS34DRAFT_603901 [Phlyctochytrium arcticum]